MEIPEGDVYGGDYQGPELPEYDEDLDESFIGPGGPQYAEDEVDYEEHWDNHEEEELYDQSELDELLSIGDRGGNSPAGASTPQPLGTGEGDSNHHHHCRSHHCRNILSWLVTLPPR